MRGSRRTGRNCDSFAGWRSIRDWNSGFDKGSEDLKFKLWTLKDDEVIGEGVCYVKWIMRLLNDFSWCLIRRLLKTNWIFWKGADFALQLASFLKTESIFYRYEFMDQSRFSNQVLLIFSVKSLKLSSFNGIISFNEQKKIFSCLHVKQNFKSKGEKKLVHLISIQCFT